MNLLIDAWIPIQQTGLQEKITLEELLCDDKEGDLCLPRDDMELACLQLLVVITQVLFTPENKKALGHLYKQPMQKEIYLQACEGKYDWFDLNHPETPFMQFRGVKVSSSSLTGLEKLLAGLDDGTNKVFINPQGLSDFLCGSCAAIALFNYANNCPNMGGGPGGGIKAGLRGNCPISVLVGGKNLRETVWLNVLTEESLATLMPWYESTKNQRPNYIDRVSSGEKISINELGLTRGLLWHPARFELLISRSLQKCSCCGDFGESYDSFRKEPFGYQINGAWPHPFSSRMFIVKKGEKIDYFPSFNSTAPTWSGLTKYFMTSFDHKSGFQEVPVIAQAKNFGIGPLQFIVGGYRSSKAMIEERRHELFNLPLGWDKNTIILDQTVRMCLGYKNALENALVKFGEGIKDEKNPQNSFLGAGTQLAPLYVNIFYQQTESLIYDALATLNFSDPDNDLEQLYSQLKKIVLSLFEQATAPYQQEPKMLKALAASRRLLNNKYLKDLEIPQGGSNE